MTDDTSAQNASPPDADTFRLMAENLPTLCWIAQADGYITWYNRRWHEYCGTTAAEMEGWGWRRVHDPAHLPQVEARWRNSISTGQPFEMTFPLRGADGLFRPFLTRIAPFRDADGEVLHWFGVNTDVSEQYAVAEQNELLSRELSHRIKNIFAVVTSLITMSARRAPEAKPFAREIVERINALSRAHEFARPHSDRSRPQVGDSTLQNMLRELLEPYPALAAGRVRIGGDDAMVDDRGATPLALLFHELATNATKYGALASEEGTVEIAIARADGMLRIDWRERGGPAVAGPPTHQGFGTQLAELAVKRQLNGSLERRWEPEGLSLTAEVQCARLVRGSND